MEQRRERQFRILEAARAYAEMGLPIIPLRGKAPAVTAWQLFAVNADSIEHWFDARRHTNIGLRTGDSGYLVIDTDTEQAEQWVLAHCPETPMQARSGAGSRHRYYAEPPRKQIRNHQGLRGILGLDVRGHGGFIVLPPSIHPATGRPYEWLTDISPPHALPGFASAWVYRRPRFPVISEPPPCEDRGHLLHRARRYLAKIEPAISGQGGHNKMYSTAIKLARFVGFNPEFLWSLLQEYNARCIPPFSERDLRHKWEDALRNGR